MKIYKVVVGELATNCYIVSSDKENAFVIDPGDDVGKIKEVIAKNKLHVRFIVNTHGHIDHIRGNADLGLPLYVHEKEADMVSNPAKNLMSAFFGTFKPVVPERLLKDGDTVALDELEFKVIHTPGHTLGCICLSNDNVLFSGDTLFKDGIGRTDFPGSSLKQMQGSLKKLLHLKDSIVVYPGHGPETTIADELHHFKDVHG